MSQQGFEFDASRLDQKHGADTRHPHVDPAIWLMPIAAIILLLLALKLETLRAPATKATLYCWAIVQRSGAAIACCGALVTLADLTILDRQPLRGLARQLHHEGWIAFAGGALCIAGIYLWNAVRHRDKI